MAGSGRRSVVISVLGAQLDSGLGEQRWNKWRPTVALCQHDDFVVDRLELLYEPRFAKLANTIVDDIARVSPETEVVLHPVAFSDAWDFEIVYSKLLDFARDYPFQPEDEEYLVHITTGTHVMQICFFLLTESRHFPGRILQTSPKGTSLAGTLQVIDLDLERYDLLKARFQSERDESLSFLKAGIATKNRRFNELIERIERVAIASSEPMLLMGPTGAGKTQLARRIYELKKLKAGIKGEWVEVNCATLRGDAAMSALFGHVRGAYTGAQKDRAGLLKQADRGLVFLDEIGELGADEQAMLLHAIEDKRFLPVGSDRVVTSDFQLIAGTNRELGKLVRAGQFREDLLARLHVWQFALPSLADRPEDIAPNLDYELERVSARLGKKISMNAEARRAFLTFATASDALWLGNFRDLGAAVTRMATLAPNARIDVATVNDELLRLRQSWSAETFATQVSEATSRSLQLLGAAARELDPFDRVQLDEVLRICQTSPSLSAAGRTLFANSRKQRASTNDADRLRKYLARFGLTFDDVRQAQS